MSNLMPPDHAHNYGFPTASFLIISIAAYLIYSSAFSEKATRELARSLGKLLGETSIHFFINFSD
jgi:hypothetical protein